MTLQLTKLETISSKPLPMARLHLALLAACAMRAASLVQPRVPSWHRVHARPRAHASAQQEDEFDLNAAFAKQVKKVKKEEKEKREEPLRNLGEAAASARAQLEERQRAQARRDLGFEVSMCFYAIVMCSDFLAITTYLRAAWNRKMKFLGSNEGITSWSSRWWLWLCFGQ